MEDRLEALIKMVYRMRKKQAKPKGEHLDEEGLVCFLEDRLGETEKESVKEHLVTCEACAEALALSLEAETSEAREVPKDLLVGTKKILDLKERPLALEVVLKMKDDVFEIIKATGDILLGQELVPAPVLRSRNIRDFKNELTILKDFKDIGLELRVENKSGRYFNLLVKCRGKQGSGSFKGLRLTLIRDALELESYLSESGAVTFEHILLGKYVLELTCPEGRLASVFLEVKA